MLIVVDPDTGQIKEPNPADRRPHVFGLTETDLNSVIDGLVTAGKVIQPEKAKADRNPYSNGDSPGGPRPKHVSVMLQTQHSPGCAWVIINGWPFCIGG